MSLEPLENRRLLAGVQLDFSEVFNQDSIRNRASGTDDASDVAIDGAGSRLVTDSFGANQSASGNGLPDDGFFPANQFHPPVQLGHRTDDDGDNIAFLPTSGDSVTVPVLAELVTSLHVFAFSTGGMAEMQVELNFADGSQTLSTTVADWLDTGVSNGGTSGDATHYYLTYSLDRQTEGEFLDSNDAAVFGHRFEVPPRRQLLSVTITNKPMSSLEVRRHASRAWSFPSSTASTASESMGSPRVTLPAPVSAARET